MSAIFGIINKHANNIDATAIEKVKKRLAHRTTDGSHQLINNNSYFWHGKLYVHPQQKNEILPFKQDDLIIVADVLLFNRDTLFSLLHLTPSIEFGDAALILAAYKKWGKECVHYLDGEYAFAIWDTYKKELFIAKDPIGFRPVYYYNSPDCFIFCSEIKGIEVAKQTPNHFNEEHIIEYHFHQSPPNQTYNKEIFALGGGNTLTFSNNNINIKKYWQLEPTGKYNFKKDEDWFDCLRDLLFKAVEKRLNPEVPIGITLSGGLDSSSIACILSELLIKKNKPLYAFSSVLPVNHQGIEEDERKYIEIINKHYPNIIQTYVEASGAGPFDNLDKAFELDEEIPNWFSYIDRALLKAAEEKKITSLYSGYGGDLWLSDKGNGVLYELLKEIKILPIIRIWKGLLDNHKVGVLDIIKNEYLPYTTIYQLYKKLISSKKDLQKKIFLNKEFIKQYHYLKFKPHSNNKKFMLSFINSGKFGSFPSRLNNRNSNYNIQSADPVFDKDVNCFLSEMPIELILFGGFKRSHLRHSLKSILPTEILWRTTKLPYDPYYSQRFLNSMQQIEDIVANKTSHLYTKYINLDEILKLKATHQPHSGFSSNTTKISIRLIQALIMLYFLNYIKDSYYFEK